MDIAYVDRRHYHQFIPEKNERRKGEMGDGNCWLHMQLANIGVE